MSENSSPKPFYANASAIFLNVYDIGLLFQTNFPKVVQGSPDITSGVDTLESILVHMSPQHAKDLALLLTEAVRHYEDQFKVDLPSQQQVKG